MEGRSTTESCQGMPDPVAFAGGGLAPYRHVYAFVDSRDEEYRILDPFVSDGVARGEKLLYVIDPAERASLERHLRHVGLDLPSLLRQRQCEVRTWSETYLRGGRFDQEAMLGLLDECLGGLWGTPQVAQAGEARGARLTRVAA
jgi:hypothetical protein